MRRIALFPLAILALCGTVVFAWASHDPEWMLSIRSGFPQVAEWRSVFHRNIALKSVCISNKTAKPKVFCTSVHFLQVLRSDEHLRLKVCLQSYGFVLREHESGFVPCVINRFIGRLNCVGSDLQLNVDRSSLSRSLSIILDKENAMRFSQFRGGDSSDKIWGLNLDFFAPFSPRKEEPRAILRKDSFGADLSSLSGFFGGFSLLPNSFQGSDSSPNASESDSNQGPIGDEGGPEWPEPIKTRILRLVYGTILLWGGCGMAYRKSGWLWGLLSLLLMLWGGLLLCAEWEQSQQDPRQNYFHNSYTVPQKTLDKQYYCGTLMSEGNDMGQYLSTDKQAAIIANLAEGSSIRSIERITGVHRDTIMRLGVRVGQGCAKLLDAKMHDLTCRHLQFDELWGFIGKKQRHVQPDDNPTLGDVWTFCAIDSDTKIVPSFKVGKRDAETANAFVSDIASRITNRAQISSDGLHAYVGAIEQAFGADVDFAQV
jgi:hypothetical protein